MEARYRTASGSELTRLLLALARLRLSMQDGDRVRVRDGSTRLSFFAVRLSISQFRIAISPLSKTFESKLDPRVQTTSFDAVHHLADRFSRLNLVTLHTQFATSPWRNPQSLVWDLGGKDLGLKRE